MSVPRAAECHEDIEIHNPDYVMQYGRARKSARNKATISMTPFYCLTGTGYANSSPPRSVAKTFMSMIMDIFYRDNFVSG